MSRKYQVIWLPAWVGVGVHGRPDVLPSMKYLAALLALLVVSYRRLRRRHNTIPFWDEPHPFEDIQWDPYQADFLRRRER